MSSPGRTPALTRALPQGSLPRLAELADRHGFDLEVYHERGYTIRRHSSRTLLHTRHLGVEPDLTASWFLPSELAPTGAVWLMPRDGWRIAKRAVAGLPTVEIARATAPWAPGVVFGNISRAGVSKAAAVQWVAQRLDIRLRDVAMIGDSDNDVDAIRVVGTGVAVGNASATVLRAADHVVPAVDEGGLAVALRLLSRTSPE